MVAVVASNTLGLLDSGLSLLGAGNQPGQAGIGQAGAHGYVNVASGNLVVQRQDQQIQGLGIDASFLRTYNSQGAVGGEVGDGWHMGFERRLIVASDGQSAKRITAGGAVQHFTMSGGVLRSTEGGGADDTLTKQNGQWVYREGSTGVQEIFDDTLRLKAILGRDGFGVRIGERDANNPDKVLRISVDVADAVVGHTQQHIRFDYSGDLLSGYTLLTDTEQKLAVHYSYSAGKLSRVSIDLTPEDGSIADGNVYWTDYEYHPTSGDLIRLDNSDGSGAIFDYYDDGRVRSVTDRENNLTEFFYNGDLTTVKIGSAEYRYHHVNGQLRQSRALVSTGKFLYTDYHYDNNLPEKLSSVTSYYGNESGNDSGGTSRPALVTYTYDSYGNLERETDAAGNSVVREYDTNNGNLLLAEKHFENGNPTALSKTQFFYQDGATGRDKKLRFSLSAEGRVVAYQYNSLGQKIRQINYNGTDQFYDGTVSLVDWVDQQTVDLAQHTEYTYNGAGQLASTTRYQIDALKSNAQATFHEALTEHFVYNAQGQLIKQVNTTGETVKDIVYDGLGRVRTSIDAGLHLTEYVYADDTSGPTVTITRANGLITTQTLDKNLQLTSLMQGNASNSNAFGTTRYDYDAQGRLETTTNAQNQTSHIIYDLKGRQLASVDALGQVTSMVYDAQGRVTTTIAHAQTLSNLTLVGVLTLQQAALNGNGEDRISRVFYDNQGRQQFTVDGEGYITEYQYTAKGELSATLRYADKGTVSENEVVVGANNAYRLTRLFYDKDGLLIASLNGEGNVASPKGILTEYRYNAGGQKVRQIDYGTTIQLTNPLSDSLIHLQTLAQNGPSQVHGWFYNGYGQLTAEVAANGLVTRLEYDAHGQVSRKSLYQTTGRIAPGSALSQMPSVDTSVVFNRTDYRYNALGQLIGESTLSGLSTRYSYDEAGNLTRTESGGVHDSEGLKVSLIEYDELGQVKKRQSAQQVKAGHSGLEYTYDNLGRVTTQMDSLGNRTVFYYNDTNQVVRTVAADGTVTDNDYNVFGELEKQTIYHDKLYSQNVTGENARLILLPELNGGGKATDEFARITQDIGSRGSQSATEYDKRGQVKTTLNGIGVSFSGSGANRTSTLLQDGRRFSYHYNAFAEQVRSSQVVDGITQATRQSFDYLGRLTQTEQGKWLDDSQSFAAGSVHSSQNYDAYGRVEQSQDANGNYTDIIYNDALNTVTTRIAGASSTVHYDVLGRTTLVTDSRNKEHKTLYLDDNRRVRTISAEGALSETLLGIYGEVLESRLGGTLSQSNDERSDIIGAVVTRYVYDADGNTLASYVDGQKVSENRFDANGWLKVSLDGEGRSITYHRDDVGRVTSEVNDLSHSTSYEYNHLGLVTLTTDGAGRQVAFQYNEQGQVVNEILDPNGIKQVTHFEYDEAGRKTSTIVGYDINTGLMSNNAIKTDYHYDVHNRLVKQLQYTNLSFNQAIEMQFDYDGNGNLIRQSVQKEGEIFVHTLYAYDAFNRVTYTLDGAGGLTHQQYDSNGNVLAQTRFVQPLSWPDPDEALTEGLVQSRQSDTVGIKTRFEYDDDNRLVYTVNAQGLVSKNIYDDRGQVIQVIRYEKAIAAGESVQVAEGGAIASQTASIYDNFGRARYSLEWLDGKAVIKSSRYDASGLLVETKSYNDLSLAYIGNGTIDLIEQHLAEHYLDTAADTRATQFFYDGAGRQVYTVDSGGLITETRYDDAGLVRVQLSYDKSLFDTLSLKDAFDFGTLSYAEVKNQAQQFAANGHESHKTTSSYDKAGRLLTTSDSSGSDTFTYFDNGLKASFTNKKGARWDYRYDAAGRLNEELGPEGQHHQVDSDGDLSTQDNVRQLTRIRYDGLGNVVKRTVGYKSSAGEVLLKEDRFGYTDTGLQKTIEQVDLRRTGGDIENVDERTTEVSYNALGQAVKQSERNRNGETVAKSYKLYNKAGQLAFEVDRNGYMTAYTYDALGNQTTMTRYSESIEVRASKNTQTAALLSALNGSVNLLTWDRVQDLLPAQTAADRTQSYQYDSLGRQTRIQLPEVSYYQNAANPAATGTPTTERIYNVHGELVLEKVLISGNADDSSAVWSQTHHYYNQSGQVVLSVDGAGYATAYEYDVLGQISRTIEYARAVSGAYSITERPVVTPSTDPIIGRDRITDFIYDLLGRQTDRIERVAHRGTSVDDVIHTSTFDELGNVTGQTQTSKGNSVTLLTQHYDGQGRLIKTEGVERSVATGIDVSSGQTGEAAISRQNMRAVTHFSYDIEGNLVQRWQQADTSQSAETPAADDVVSRYVYNALGQQIRQFNLADDGNNVVIDSKYDGLGNLSQTRQVYQKALFDHHVLNVDYTAMTLEDGKMLTAPNSSLPDWVNFDRESGKLFGIPQVFNENGSETLHGIALYEGNNRISLPSTTWSVTDGVYTEFYLLGSQQAWEDADYGPDEQSHLVKYQTFTYDKEGQQTGQLTYAKGLTGADGTEIGEAMVSSQSEQRLNAFGELIRSYADDISDSAAYTYDNAGRLTQSPNAAGAMETHRYDLAGRLVQTLTPGLEGRIVAQTQILDSLGRSVAQQRLGSEGQTLSTRQQFDRWGNVLVATDALGHETRYQYNHRNQMTKETRPLVKVMGADGVARFELPVFENYYDEFGRLTKSIDANKVERFNHYDEAGQLIGQTDGEEHRVNFYYDNLGRKVATSSATGYVNWVEFDSLGRVAKSGDIRFDKQGSLQKHIKTINQYNELGHKIAQSDGSGGNQSYYLYDAEGRVTLSRTPAGVLRSYAYDLQGRKEEEVYEGKHTDAYGGENQHRINWDYDYFGKLTSVNDLAGRQITYKYDDDSAWLVSETSTKVDGDTARRNKTYIYYANGQLKRINDNAFGNYSEYDYDGLGRIIREYHEHSSPYKLNLNSREESKITYDSHSRMTSVTVRDRNRGNDIINRTQYTYDAVGNRRSISVENGFKGYIDDTLRVMDNGSLALEESIALPFIVQGSDDYRAEVALSNLFVSESLSGVSLTGTPQGQTSVELPDWLKVSKEQDRLVFSVPAGKQAPMGLNAQSFDLWFNVPGMAEPQRQTFTLYLQSANDVGIANSHISVSPLVAGEDFVRHIDIGQYFYDAEKIQGFTLTGTNLPSWLSDPKALQWDGQALTLRGEIPSSDKGQSHQLTLIAQLPFGQSQSVTMTVQTQPFALKPVTSVNIPHGSTLDLLSTLVEGDTTGLTVYLKEQQSEGGAQLSIAGTSVSANDDYKGVRTDRLLSVVVSQGGNLLAQRQFTVTQGRSTTVSGDTYKTFAAEQRLNHVPLNISFKDANHDIAGYTVSGALPDGVSLTFDEVQRKFVLNGTFPGASVSQSYQLTLSAKNAAGNTLADTTVTLAVSAPQAPENTLPSYQSQLGDGGSNTLTGSAGRDLLYGLAGNDTLQGLAGNDILYGGSELDQLLGGDGNDILVLQSGDGQVNMYGGSGIDTVYLEELTRDNTTIYINENGHLLLRSKTNTSDFALIANWQNSTDKIEQVRFSDDSYLSRDEIDQLLRSTQSQTLHGTLAGDILAGFGGDDILYSSGGLDLLYGGGGDDTFIYQQGSGQENLFGGDGVDTLLMEGYRLSDVNLFINGNGNLVIEDALNYQNFAVAAGWQSGQRHIEQIQFSDGITFSETDIAQFLATIHAPTSAPTEIRNGESVAFNYTYGNSGHNYLYGNAYNDRMYGSDGHDRLDGGGGWDYLWGDAGDDTFVFRKGNGQDNIYGGSGFDTLRFADLNRSDVNIYLNQNGHLILEHDQNKADFALIADWQSNTADIIEQVVFADGVRLTQAELEVIVPRGTSSSSSQTLMSSDTTRLMLADSSLQSDSFSSTTQTGHLKKRQSKKALLDEALPPGMTATAEVAEPKVTGKNKKLSQQASDPVQSNTLLRTSSDSPMLMTAATATPGITVTGNPNDNTLYGTSGDDTLEGLGGNDDLWAGEGNDTLYGGDGEDILRGHGGDDILYGGNDWDRMMGDDGNDTLYGEGGGDAMVGGAGDDLMLGGAGVDSLNGGLGKDDLQGGDDGDYLYGEEDDDKLYGQAGDDMLDGGAGNDTLYGQEGNDELYGREGNDTIYVGSGSNQAWGNDGDDTIYGSDSGNDSLYGGLGNDLLMGSLGDDTLEGEGGDDDLWGQDGVDTLKGGDGEDILRGGAGNDTLYGGNDWDRMMGDEGDDTLYGEGGGDAMVGGTGDDKLYGGAGVDSLNGGIGKDELHGGDDGDYLYGEADDDILLGEAGDDTLDGGAGNDTLFGQEGNDQLYGRDGDDIIYAGSGSNQAWGNDGDDTIYGSDSGNDFLYGGTGKDQMFGSLGDDTLEGEAGDDDLWGQDGMDTLKGGDGEDILRGGTGNDTLYGGNDWDRMMGDEGDDTLYGEGGGDAMIGGSGDDKLYGGAGVDSLNGGIGKDELHGGDDGDYLYGEDDDDILLGEAGDDVLDGGAGDDVLYGQEGNDELVGREGNDIIYAGSGSNKAWGNEGDDTIYGSSSGDDLLYGGTGKDLMYGSLGDDTLEGEAGDDDLWGQDGADTLRGGDGEDILRGGTGNDTLYGGNDWDRMMGDEGDDTLYGEGGGDAIVGGAGNDQLYGGDGADSLQGDSGNDRLEGGSGNDQMFGGEGDDILDGGAGDDHIDGGSGHDTFYFGIGDGHDVFVNSGAGTLQFKPGVNAANVSYERVGQDLKITIAPSGDSVTVSQWFNDANAQLTTIRFDDGSSAELAALNSQLSQLTGTVGTDTLTGGNLNDVLSGLAGNDTLVGQLGDDVYVFNLGDGNDTVIDTGGVDVLRFGPGIDFSQVHYSQSGNDMVFTLTGSGETVTVQNWYLGAEHQLERVEFSDTTLTRSFGNGEDQTPYSIAAVQSVVVTEQETFKQTLISDVNQYFKDPNGQPLTVTIEGLPDGLVFDGKDLKGAAQQAGLYTLRAKVTDPEGHWTFSTFNLQVSASGKTDSHQVKQLAPVSKEMEAGTSVSYYLNDLLDYPNSLGELELNVKSGDGTYRALYQHQAADWFSWDEASQQLTISPDYDDSVTLQIKALDSQGQQVWAELDVRAWAILTAAKGGGAGSSGSPGHDSLLPPEGDLPDPDGPSDGTTGGGGDGSIPVIDTTDVDVFLQNLTLRSGSNNIEVPLADMVEKAYRNAGYSSAVFKSWDATEVSTDGGVTFTSVSSSAISGWIRAAGISPRSFTLNVPSEHNLGYLHFKFSHKVEVDGVVQTHKSYNRIDLLENTASAERTSGSTSWYTYDKENRVVLDGGKLEGSTLTGGKTIRYNADGKQEVVISNAGQSANYFHYDLQGNQLGIQQGSMDEADSTKNFFSVVQNEDVLTLAGSTWGYSTRYEYDSQDRQIKTTHYYEAGQYQLVNEENVGSVRVNLGGAIKEVTDTTYDADGKVKQVESYGLTGAQEIKQWVKNKVNLAAKDGQSIEFANLDINMDFDTLRNNKTDYFYDYDGLMRSYKMTNYLVEEDSHSHDLNFAHRYRVAYTGMMQYLEKSVTGSNLEPGADSDGHYDPAKTVNHYDTTGNRIASEEYKLTGDGTEHKSGTDVHVKYFDYSQKGEVIKRLNNTRDKTLDKLTLKHRDVFTGEKISHYINAGGQFIGEVRENGVSNIRSQHFNIDSSGKAQNASRHLVQSGDTLTGLAQQYYGDESYWYIIADANGLSSDRLTAGTSIDIPQVTSGRNQFNRFNPQDLSQIYGSTTPNLPYSPAAQDCNAVQSIVVIAISVVVTQLTAGAAAGAFTSFWSGFIGGMAGSVVSQSAGVLMGYQDSVDLKAALTSAVTTGASYGINDAIKTSGNLDLYDSVAKEMTPLGSALQAGGNTLVANATNKVLGNPSGFSWANVAASMGSAAIGNALGLSDPANDTERLSTQGIVKDTLGGIVRSTMSHSIKKALGGSGNYDFKDVAVDAFGNALGNSIIAEMHYKERISKTQNWLDNLNMSGSSGLGASVNVTNFDDSRSMATQVISGAQPVETQKVMPAIDLNDPDNLRMLEAIQSFQKADIRYTDELLGDILHNSKNRSGDLDKFSLARELAASAQSLYKDFAVTAGVLDGIATFVVDGVVDLTKAVVKLGDFALDYTINGISNMIYQKNYDNSIGDLFSERSKAFKRQVSAIGQVARNAPEIVKQGFIGMVSDLKRRDDNIQWHMMHEDYFNAGHETGYLFAVGVTALSLVGLVGKAGIVSAKSLVDALSKWKSGRVHMPQNKHIGSNGTHRTDGEMDEIPSRSKKASINSLTKENIHSSSGKVIGEYVKDSYLKIISKRKSIYGGNIIELNGSKTTTITGRLHDVNVVAERGINLPGLTVMGENKGGINILRSPAWNEIQQKHIALKQIDESAYWAKVTDEFWETANKPWLAEAMNRGDNIRLVSDPNNAGNIYQTVARKFVYDAKGNRVKSIFGRELDFLKENGYSILSNGIAVKN